MTSAETRKATSVGGIAILVWSTLAILTTLSGDMPPFQLVIWGLFGYHFLYFMAFRLAPPVEVNLLNYLWPLLIVLLSAFLPGESLRWWHIVGTILAVIGTVILIAGGEEIAVDLEYIPGYAAAVGAAIVWSTYSVISRKFRQVPTEMITGYCGVTAVLALLSHLIFESTVTPQGMEWAVVLAIGIGPVGTAFYVWDHGIKRGDIRVLGVGSYIIPLLSTGLLVLFGPVVSSWKLWVSCVLIVAGALVAGREMFRDR
jgi:drug/metabolite transporter (DMT)-like permease